MSTSIDFLSTLEQTIQSRLQDPDPASYTARLVQEGVQRVAQKVGEEAVETALAAVTGNRDELIDESADLIYHLLVLLNSQDLSLGDIAERLESRHAS